MNRKYVLTDDCITVDGRQLHRIECARFFRSLYPGAPGGYIEHEGNLSHDGNAWVADDAMVMGDAVVEDDALVVGNACVRGEARISGNALIYGNAIVSDRAIIKDDTEMKGHAQVSGNAQVYGRACISGYAQVDDYAMVYGNAHICGDALVSRCIDYLNIGNLHRESNVNGNSYSVTAFVTENKTISVVHAPSLIELPYPPVTIEEFEAEVEKMYGATVFIDQYRAVVSLIKAWKQIALR